MFQIKIEIFLKNLFIIIILNNKIELLTFYTGYKTDNTHQWLLHYTFCATNH